ncbi:HypC/HybG/HupF family hydrogenase formation chaperone [Clostridium sp. 'White wine YQ']|uniref:HypC/HybG/HupF family hydrogenase formation chaperone n=1 Tax=Clostridium sp. 'White wine YQ' TaxID=3027474 RepID=UPI00236663C6|nr:HypC/HybG/HupF family hydrogenase formation chaperone [Clostridium sp. 'White wine YQ']MDD7794571.1 HypC/HybG/HupF family hydrogenase formation chaperone [Clostridium sp. 'White wine YQ']
MGITIPLKVIEINGNEALGEINGMRKNVRIDFIDSLEEGDYILINSGVALNKVSKKDALEIKEYLDSMSKL